jgi:hypothetical protein
MGLIATMLVAPRGAIMLATTAPPEGFGQLIVYSQSLSSYFG